MGKGNGGLQQEEGRRSGIKQKEEKMKN